MLFYKYDEQPTETISWLVAGGHKWPQATKDSGTLKACTENSGVSVDINGDWELPELHGSVPSPGGMSIGCSTVSPWAFGRGQLATQGEEWNEMSEQRAKLIISIQVNFKRWESWAAILPTSQRKNPNDGSACQCRSSRRPGRLKCVITRNWKHDKHKSEVRLCLFLLTLDLEKITAFSEPEIPDSFVSREFTVSIIYYSCSNTLLQSA